MNPPHLTAITGGIGAGKSVISRILRTLGYEVFDCDIEARRLMDADPEIKRRLKEEISPETVTDNGTIDRRRLSEIVFADKSMLEKLNAIVHASVRDEIDRWRSHPERTNRLFVETAILYESGLDRMVDDVWCVTAPEDIRIARVIARNNCSEDDVRARIESQNFIPSQPHPNLFDIINDGFAPVLPRVLSLL